ncbi:MAG: bifunctional 5,10-methylenetetrahydrofolate dehydrogenase/5,10-methenyltetrahydrofolate cyclohydrolase [Planctomycetes bacterium]|nr:bifunctional 5,10-methylenetetrahydrofolate dehydrogenase/5,10-methenyltetrahydrofolate cyclohydrolase [Planctomycetota bacterium]
MPAQILDGKALAKKMMSALKDECETLKGNGIAPKLVSIQVAGDDASSWYIRNQGKQAAKVGIEFEHVELPADCDAATLEATITRFNEDKGTHGMILQVPLPKHLDGDRFQQMIAPHKDVEGMTNASLGELLRDGDDLVPCTARAAVELVVDAELPIQGKHCVVVGRSAIVGKPLALMMLARHAHVTICHSRTPDLPAVCRQADILMTAVGRTPGMIDASYVKEGAVVVDIATIATDEGSITGDVDAASVAEVASWLAPVPGGVGPVTVCFLLRNALRAAARSAMS